MGYDGFFDFNVSEEVLNYIEHLKNIFPNGKYTARLYYCRGGCYEFASKLKEKFPKGKLAVTHEFQHVLFLYNDVFYDVDGVFEDIEDIMITEEHLVPSTLKLISSFKCDLATLKPKSDWMETMKNFTYHEKCEFEDFCFDYDCTETLEELDRALAM